MFSKIKQSARGVIRRLSRRQWLVLVAAIALLWLFAATFIPHTIAYTYAEDSCDAQLVLLPSFRRSEANGAFVIKYQGGAHAGKHHLFSTQACAVAMKAPEQGSFSVRSSLSGLLLPTLYHVRVPKAPSLRSIPTETEVAITKPLQLALDGPDVVYAYRVIAKERSQECSLKAATLHCKLDKLGLEQGAIHELSVVRSFKSGAPERLATSRVTILPAVVVTARSIQPDEVVYAVPKELTITTDKALTAAKATIDQLDSGATKPVAVKVELRDTTVVLLLAADLPREKTFRVTLHTATSSGGTTLSEPYMYTFTTSGGPKVTGVNIGSSGTASDATIRISFDQPLAANQDIAKYVQIDGVTANISYETKEVRLVLTNAPRCTAFTLKLVQGLRGENNVTGTSPWSYASRINCRSTKIIGYSVNDRPIVAYYYGSGSTTVLFTGGIHGTEASGSYILQDWIVHLDANAYKIPSGRQVVVVPQTNPDGLASGSRDNARGVNIDRNFPTANWRKDINSANGYRPGGGGESAASEPETKVLIALTAQLRPRLEVSYHAQGSVVGASACSASPVVARSYASSVGYGTMIGTAEEAMGYELTGEYEEWICEAYGTPAILIELPTRTGHYLSSHLNAMWQMVSY